MPQHFTPIASVDAWEGVVAASDRGPMIVFKHDTSCPISAAAYREISQISKEVALVDVGEHDDVAQEIAARTGVEHESPQVLVLDRGRALWTASHYDISCEAVAAALQRG